MLFMTHTLKTRALINRKRIKILIYKKPEITVLIPKKISRQKLFTEPRDKQRHFIMLKESIQYKRNNAKCLYKLR